MSKVVVIRTDHDFDLHLHLGDHPVPNAPHHVGEAEFLALVAEHGRNPQTLKAALARRGEEDFDDVMFA
jgi:hypothetical protein